MCEWQPIETAPKDGTEILGWRKDCGPMLIRWTYPREFLTERELDDMDDDSSDAQGWFCADFIAGFRLDEYMTPTHWISLPEPPKGEA